jgi:hypothetical protein
MSYASTIQEIRTAANAVNPNGRFSHGRHVDLSQMYEGDYAMIYLYPININKSVDPDFIDTNTILLGFFMQDKPHSTNEERESIIALMDTLSDEFLSVLNEMKAVKVSSVSKEPQYQMYQGTLSGFALRFNYQNFSPCDPNDPE